MYISFFICALYSDYMGAIKTVSRVVKKNAKPVYPCDYYEGRGQELIEFMSEGYSLEAWLGYVRLTKRTLDNWVRDYPDFAVAVELAEYASLYGWEKLARMASQGILPIELEEKGSKGINIQMVQFVLKTRFNRVYSEKIQVENSGTVEQQVRIIMPSNGRNVDKENLQVESNLDKLESNDSN